jgi:lipoprotein signal peptidase
MSMSSARARKYWFPAKRYGWGWGLPSAWQGWVVLVTYLLLILGGIPFVQASKGSVLYLAYGAVLTAALVAVCWITGEPPGWRWGGRDDR